jgi:hypothetical protein
MEADWEFDLAADSPVIEARWPGFVDLHARPEAAASLSEAVAFPPLARALTRLNELKWPVWTTKCDFFPELAPDEFDARELDALESDALHACALYVDLLPRSDQQWSFPQAIAKNCKLLCARIHAVSLRACRIDLVIRRAHVGPDESTLGITAYVTACGAAPAAARTALAAALDALVDSVLTAPLSSNPQ